MSDLAGLPAAMSGRRPLSASLLRGLLQPAATKGALALSSQSGALTTQVNGGYTLFASSCSLPARIRRLSPESHKPARCGFCQQCTSYCHQE